MTYNDLKVHVYQIFGFNSLVYNFKRLYGITDGISVFLQARKVF
jgi:hypothetical protein